MKNPFIEIALMASAMQSAFRENALMASAMQSAFRENALRSYAGPLSRRSRRHGNSQQRSVVPKAFRQYNRRYGSNIGALVADHKKYQHTPTIDEAKRLAKPNIFVVRA